MDPILIVDDKHEILSLIKWELKEEGILSMQADSCESAIELLEEISFSAIFLDIVLGDEQSSTILSFLSSENNLLNIEVPIVVMSGLIDKKFSEKHANKFYAILEKPFSDNEIRAIARRIKELNEVES